MFAHIVGKKELKLSGLGLARRGHDSGFGEVFEIETKRKVWNENLCFSGGQISMLPDCQEVISFCSMRQAVLQTIERSQWSHKRPQRFESQYVPIKILRPMDSYQADFGAMSFQEHLKAIRRDLERIRKVISEVICLWPLPVESLRGYKFRNLPLLCKDQVQPLVQRKSCSKCNSNTELKKAPLNSGNSTAFS